MQGPEVTTSGANAAARLDGREHEADAPSTAAAGVPAEPSSSADSAVPDVPDVSDVTHVEIDVHVRSHPARGDVASPPRRVAVIGSSAGGLSALEGFFGGLPATTGVAFVVLQHASPDFESLLPELLARRTPLPVRAGRDGDPLVADEVLVVPPGHRPAFEDGRLRLVERDPAASSSVAVIDGCFRSLADAWGPRAIGIVLSGTGDDGAVGVEHVAAAGGTVIVQSPDTAEFAGMPDRAIATGRADHVLEPAEAARVLAWLGTCEPSAERLFRAAREGSADSVFAIVRELAEAEEACGLDRFDGRMLARRILQRMLAIGASTPEDYAERLRWDVEERRRLREAMVDGESSFFRDPDAWRTLQELVVRRLVVEAGGEPIRAWVVGCAGGEDAYATAMLFEEEMERAGRRVPYKVFATDLLASRVERASGGRFDAEILSPIPLAMRRRSFDRQGGAAVVTPLLRRQLVFARHDVRTDPAFTRLDLVVCRGVLGAFDATGRRQALSRIAYGLRPRGTLFVGPHELPAEGTPRMRPLHRDAGLFTRRADGTSAPGPGPGPVAVPGLGPGDLTGGPRRERAGRSREREQVLEAALESVLAARPGRLCLIVGTDGQLHHAFGETESFLAVRPGAMRTRVPELLLEPLRQPVEAAMERVLRAGEPVTIPGIVVRGAGGERVVEATVAPASGDGADERQVSIVVETVPDAASAAEAGAEAADAVGPEDGGGGAGGIAGAGPPRLAAELRRTREALRELGDELSNALRQRHALAEELAETSRRAHEHHAELMSVNEELYTVNREHEAKIRELVTLNNDMENLLRTAHIGTIFLDRDLRVRRRTPAADVLFDSESRRDAGVEQLRLPAGEPSLVPDLREVIAAGVDLERQIRLDDGRDYLLRLHPYRRTDDGRLDGVVLTIVDVTDLKKAERQLRRLNEELRHRNQEAEAFAHTVSHDLKSPLVTIGCMMGLLRESLSTAADPEPVRYVDQTEATVRSMRQTIDDLLELSRVGRTRNRLVDVDLGELVEEVQRGNAVHLAREGIELRVAPDPPTIRADRRRLVQVLDNLVSNAIKYGCDGEGPHAVDVEWEDAGDRVVVSVSDRGPGVPEAFREQVFGLFQRLRRDRAGTGVGLALVRRIVEAHGGRTWIEGRPGGGACFRVELPREGLDDETLELVEAPDDGPDDGPDDQSGGGPGGGPGDEPGGGPGGASGGHARSVA